MGLTKNMIQLLLSSKEKRKVDFESMVMIGRQALHLSDIQLKDCLSFFGYSSNNVKEIITKDNGFAEGLFRLFGSQNIDSLDASDYEEASIIHDLNQPISNRYKNKYDLVLDSGTIEHVFNVPVALKNCMELTKEGGHFIGIYPCNNFFGHGFYQFSSELFYRTLSKENGFKIIDVIVFVDDPKPTFYSVPDTSEEYQRILLLNSKSVYLYVVAKKIKTVEIFKESPLQMDYSQLKWNGIRSQVKRKKKKKKLSSMMPQYLKNLVKALLNSKPSDDSLYFKKPFLIEYKLK